MKKKIVVSFSGGKDSALALHRLLKEGNWEIDSLLTTVTSDFNRVSMHGIREDLLERQAVSLGYNLRKVEIPKDCPNDVYQRKMGEAINQICADGIHYIMFGDIHLEDVKQYREKMLEGTGITPIFPLWKEKSELLINEFLSEGFRTRLVCVDTEQLDSVFLGREIDWKFVEDYPTDADICGENGEYHTFIFDGPIFSFPINHTLGEKHGKHFQFLDVIPE